jgi:2-polyprenyl-3-methyl-5-hydroxy-6-metoxy-1,4-benzoquinol methylase
LEDVNYFRETLHYNYLYKGPVLEWYQRIKVSMEKNYSQFNELVPASGNILDIGCGYGFLCYMLHFVSKERNITGIDYDEEKIATAMHCFSKSGSVNFHYADAMAFEFEEYDCIILSDILHYLQPADQEALMEKSIKHLKNNGVIIIRDGNAALSNRHRGTRVTEFFSTKLLGFNKTNSGGLSFLQGDMIHNIAGRHNMDCREIDNTRLTSNIIFVVREKAAVADYGKGN